MRLLMKILIIAIGLSLPAIVPAGEKEELAWKMEALKERVEKYRERKARLESEWRETDRSLKEAQGAYKAAVDEAKKNSEGKKAKGEKSETDKE